MIKIDSLTGLLAVLLLISSCQNRENVSNGQAFQTPTIGKSSFGPEMPNNKEQTDVYVYAAIETCNCMHPMLEKVKHLKELEMKHQVTEMKQIAQEMALLQPQIQKCSEEISQKYEQISREADKKRIRAAVLTECPDIAIIF